MHGRRRGACNASKRSRNEQAVPTKTFPAARAKLNEILKAFTFLKVSEITKLEAKGNRGEFYHGIGVICSNSRYSGNEKTQRVFFDKGGRLRHNATLDVGPCKLIDAAWGKDHFTSMPQQNDIIVGVLEENTRAGGERTGNRISKVLRSWSRHGKIIMELSRLVEFGTTSSEMEIRNLLYQNECAMAEQASASLAIGGGTNDTYALLPDRVKKLSSSADDFWMLARIVLWGTLRSLVVLHSMQSGIKCKNEPSALEITSCSDLKISCSAYEFVSGVSFRLEDGEILREFSQEFNEIPQSPAPEAFQARIMSPFANTAIKDSAFSVSAYGGSKPYDGSKTPPWELSGSKTPEYVPSSPAYVPRSPAYPRSPAHVPRSPEYAPRSPQFSSQSPTQSPTFPSALRSPPRLNIQQKILQSPEPPSSPYAPKSPEYAPSSPYVPKSPEYAPSSPYAPKRPEYAPKRPEYAPKSPEYAPSSPKYAPQIPLYKSSSPQYAPKSPENAPRKERKILNENFAGVQSELVSYQDI